ncbi:MAG: TerB family tellurite resistance protein [Ignavibacteriaceae bacterium]|nr:TerB family tellurite resistance protein [Ignavibacteriaceae bacterium]
MPIDDYKYLRNLGYLYLAFAHLSDSVLSDSEMAEIIQVLRVRTGANDFEEAQKLMNDVIDWYNKSAENRLQIIAFIAKEIHIKTEDPQAKVAIIEDLISIAKADTIVNETERNFINSLISAWELNYNF